ncbi:MAG: hypothetical protein WA915_05825 [Candidatus Aminicenantaceae bacterium]
MRKKILLILVMSIFISLLVSPGMAQWKRVYYFKDVDVPFNLKTEDKILEKSKYDFEILKDFNQALYYLSIRQKGKRICNILGEYLYYKQRGAINHPEVPDKPKFGMRRNPVTKDVIIIFESGRKYTKYPFVKIRFKLKYEE